MILNTEEDRKWSPAWTLAVASLALMMAFLDALVVTTALPTLRVALHASLTSLEWTVNAYNLAFACLLLAGLAPTIGVLVAARACRRSAGTGSSGSTSPSAWR